MKKWVKVSLPPSPMILELGDQIIGGKMHDRQKEIFVYSISHSVVEFTTSGGNHGHKHI